MDRGVSPDRDAGVLEGLARRPAPPEAMVDVQGGCELPLTRAVVQYRDLHERDVPGGRIRDIGLGLVLEGRYAASSQVLDLGSGSVRTLDLGASLVILDWVYEPTLDHVHDLILEEALAGEEARSGSDSLQRFAFRIARGVLERSGFSYLTRPTLLRIGFRDLCQDLDLHDGTAFRLLLGDRRVARIHMDYDAASLVVRTGRSRPDGELETALGQAFPGGTLRRGRAHQPTGTVWYELRPPIPRTLPETRAFLHDLRNGLLHLLARYEPARARAVRDTLSVLGPRDTLGGLHLRDLPGPETDPVDGPLPAPSTVH